jgi:hypothetical protein
MTNDELAEARRRAMYWIEPGYCEPVTRETAINEEHLALDVIALLSHVEQLTKEAVFERILDRHDKEVVAVALALAELGRQLAVAAALTRAWNSGELQSAAMLWDNGLECVSDEAKRCRPWNPGCGRRMP